MATRRVGRLLSMRKRFGAALSDPDARDESWRAEPSAVAALPPSADLRPELPPVYDQRDFSSCVAQAVGAAVVHARRRQGLAALAPSALFLDYCARAHEGTLPMEHGVQVRSGLHAARHSGVAPNPVWPYVKRNRLKAPPPPVHAAAEPFRGVRYEALPDNDVDHLRASLAEGVPVIVAIVPGDEFRALQGLSSRAREPVARPPARPDQRLRHAVLAVGYRDGMIWIRNSWGPRFGREGHCLLPEEHFTDRELAAEFWRVASVSDPPANREKER